MHVLYNYYTYIRFYFKIRKKKLFTAYSVMGNGKKSCFH